MQKVTDFLESIYHCDLNQAEIFFFFLMKDRMLSLKGMYELFDDYEDRWIKDMVERLYKKGYLRKTGRGGVYLHSKRGGEFYVDIVRKLVGVGESIRD